MASTALALAAGAIGSVVALLATAGVRFFAARGEIATHDRLFAELDQDLERWVADDHVRLKRELDAIKASLAARKMLNSGDYAYELNLAKERALQMYRDQETRAQREATRARASEGWMHSLWRRREKTPIRQLAAPQKVKPVIDAWRAPPMSPVVPSHPVPVVSDPTERSIDKTIADVQANPQKLV